MRATRSSASKSNPAAPPRPDARPSLRYLDHTYPAIEPNLALDEALLVAAEERGAGAVLRVWESPGLAVVLGASGRTSEDVEVELCRAEGVPIARRSSGGGTVLIGPGALNVTVVLPADFAPGLHAVDTSQTYVLERTARGLRGLVPGVRLQGTGDLTVGDRKFAGSAQRRLKRHFLVHTSLLYDFPAGPIARYTRTPRRQPAYRNGRPHETFLTSLGHSREAVLGAVRSAWLEPDPEAAPIPDDLVRDLVRDKFADPAWVGRF
jgi:lipoate-protein ligase A